MNPLDLLIWVSIIAACIVIIMLVIMMAFAAVRSIAHPDVKTTRIMKGSNRD